MPTTDQARPKQQLPIDPRIRQRRVSVIRETGRRRLRILLGVAGLSLLVVLALFVLHSPLLTVKNLVISGNPHESEARVAALVGLRQGATPMIDANPGAVAAKLEALPWVANARVERHWPWSLSVAITTRVPVATVDGSHGAKELVDGSGRLLGPWQGQELPALQGAGTVPLPGGYLSRPAQPMLAVAARLPASLEPSANPGSGVRQISVVAGGEVEMTWGGGLQVLLGPPTDLAAKFDALATMVAKADLTAATRIDLTLPGQPAVTTHG